MARPMEAKGRRSRRAAERLIWPAAFLTELPNIAVAELRPVVWAAGTRCEAFASGCSVLAASVPRALPLPVVILIQEPGPRSACTSDLLMSVVRDHMVQVEVLVELVARQRAMWCGPISLPLVFTTW